MVMLRINLQIFNFNLNSDFLYSKHSQTNYSLISLRILKIQCMGVTLMVAMSCYQIFSIIFLSLKLKF